MLKIGVMLAMTMMLGACHAMPGSDRTEIVVVRHGQSQANAAHKIASTFATASKRYGLTAEGRTQATRTAKEIQQAFVGREYVIVTSPLLRTVQTAQILAQTLSVTHLDVIRDARFIERDFSAFELQSDDNYERVWKEDRQGHNVAPIFNNQVEELAHVRQRTQKAIADYTALYPGKVILIVTHGDVASNIIAVNENAPLSRHREVGALPTAGYKVLRAR